MNSPTPSSSSLNHHISASAPPSSSNSSSPRPVANISTSHPQFTSPGNISSSSSSVAYPPDSQISQPMNLEYITLTRDVYKVALHHALSTEHEEVMGLCLGDWQPIGTHRWAAHIWALSVFIRSDKRPDRVEIPPTELSQATSLAEQISETCGRKTVNIGWYHSHPRTHFLFFTLVGITVNPSHVDTRTQFGYQRLDPRFFGIIFSVFNTQSHPPTKLSPLASASTSIELLGFQSVEIHDPASSKAYMEYVKIPVHVIPGNQKIGNYISPTPTFLGTYHCILKVVDNLFTEEKMAYQSALESGSNDNGETSPLHTLRCTGIYMNAVAKLLEFSLIPTLRSVESKANFIKALKKVLQETNPKSPKLTKP